MDFDEWERMREETGASESLFDAIGRTVSSAYGDIVPCPNCGKITNTFKDFSGKCGCQHCDHTWYE